MTMKAMRGVAVGIVLFGGFGEAAASSGKIYWSNQSLDQTLVRAGIDGRRVEDVITTRHHWDMVVDAEAGVLYWTDNDRDKINRANLDGSDNEVIIDVDNPNGIAFDDVHRKVYWTSYNNGLIRRANPDGEDVEILHAGGHGMTGIDLDVGAGKMYWAETDAQSILRANLDGSDGEILVVEDAAAQWLAVDPAADLMFWTSADSHLLRRARLDGSEVATIYGGGQRKEDVALDRQERKVYWAEYAAIYRADYDGAKVEVVVDCGIGFARGIEVVVTEACALADGVCDDLPPMACIARGGAPRGADTSCATLCPADIDNDGAVRLTDLVRLLSAWGPCCRCGADLDIDGVVGAKDLMRLIETWGGCP